MLWITRKMARAWERMLPSGDCLVLAVWKTALFGKPERKEWTFVRFTDDTPGGDAGPMTLSEALDVARTLSGLPGSPGACSRRLRLALRSSARDHRRPFAGNRRLSW